MAKSVEQICAPREGPGHNSCLKASHKRARTRSGFVHRSGERGWKNLSLGKDIFYVFKLTSAQVGKFAVVNAKNDKQERFGKR